MSQPAIRVLVVDDHPLMREALVIAIESAPGLQVVGEAVNGQDALQQVAALHPDVILMDVLMPVMNGIEAARALQQAHLGGKILVLTSATEKHFVLDAVQAGAFGYLDKDSSRNDVIEGIRTVARGGYYFPAPVAGKLAAAVQEARSDAHLTGREKEILALLAEGLSNSEICERLMLTSSTVRVHLRNMQEKLKLHNRQQLARYALQHLNHRS